MSYGMKKCEAEGLYTQAQELAAKWVKCHCLQQKQIYKTDIINF